LFTKSGLQSRRAFSTLAQETRIISPRLGGRSSVSGIVCTVFGGSGQTGKYVIDRLGSSGCSLIVPYRDDGMWVRVCKVSGDPGQIQPMPYDLKDEDSIRQVVAKSNIVINLTGTSKSTSHFDLREANCFVPHRIAKVCKEVGVERFIHFSALGASKESSSKFFQAKAESEEAVKSFYPNATIIR
jgi:NADH dehydrogenase (ubiquinone) 1 alpha subcomplex subunit 9